MKINIVDVLEQYFKDNTADEYVVDISHDTEYEELKIDKVSEHTRAYIKIQDGCMPLYAHYSLYKRKNKKQGD